MNNKISFKKLIRNLIFFFFLIKNNKLLILINYKYSNEENILQYI